MRIFFFISERSGTISKVDESGTQRQEVQLSEDLSNSGEAGFLGFLLDPNFEENNEASAYYTYVNDNGIFNKIVKLQLVEDHWEEIDILLDNIPGGNYHGGGRLAIGPDDKLYATVGDTYNEEDAQSSDSLVGSILRLNLDGSIPEDNPFENNYVYSYGHRNPQGLVWDSEGVFYASEHGDNQNDEVNVIEPGNNYGWPIIEGNETGEGMKAPLFTSGSGDTWAPSGMDIRDNKLYVAALRGTAILEMDLENHSVSSLIDDAGRIRDVLIEDNYLYYVTYNLDSRGEGDDTDDKLYRIDLTDK